jgi:hypothetical protein
VATVRLRFAGQMMTQSLFRAGHPTISLLCPSLLAMEKLPLSVAPAEANRRTRRLLRHANLPVKKWVAMGPMKLSLIVRAKLPAKVIQAELVLQANQFVSQRAQQRLVCHRAAAKAMLQHLLLPKATRREQRRHSVTDSPARRVRVRRYSQDPDRCAFSRETLAARRCNRAARCGGFPTCARCRLPRNRRGLARCDNRCSRLRHTRAPRVRPFPIAAGGNDPPLPPLIAD